MLEYAARAETRGHGIPSVHPNAPALEILRASDAGVPADEHRTVVERAHREDRNRGERLPSARAQSYVVIAISEMSNSRPRTMRRNARMICGTSSNSKSNVRGVIEPSFNVFVWPRVTNAVFNLGRAMESL
jgi:hypothetical protein